MPHLMRSRFVLLAAMAAACLGVERLTLAAEVAGTSALGRKAANFTLNDFYGAPHSLADFKDKKVVVLAFLGTECPLAKLYGPRLAELNKKYADKGVQFLGVNSNRQDAITEIASYARVAGIDFPILKDLNNKVADQLGAARTPEIFVLDQDRVIRYHGRIDDQYGVGYVRKSASEQYLVAAVDELLSGKSVSKSDTGAVGCFIGRVHSADASSKVTYSNQVVRILNKRCVICHRAGEVAPFAMTSYDEVSGWADTIAEVVRNRRMPPWHADPRIGHFANDRSMPEEEKEVLYQWAAAGAPEGDPKELPPTPKYVDGWQLPKAPDKIFYMSEKPYTVPATGTVEYKYFMVDPKFTEDKWIKAIEAKPGNRAVVHHIIVFSVPKEQARDEGRRQFLVGYAPGAMAMSLPPGMAKLVHAGDQLLFQVHYTPNGKQASDRSEVAIVFADPKEVNRLVRTVEAINTGFEIPAGADNYKVEATSPKWNFDMDLVQLFPHMHLRGKSFEYEVRYPDGKVEKLLDVPHYDFGWQLTYQLDKMRHLPKGTVIHCTAHFDNSENNLNNPDPKSPVRWGDQTWEEMMIGFYDVSVPMSEADVKAGKLPDFTPGVEQIAQSIMQRFDKNHDGKITRDEIPLQAQFFFGRLDLNKDGKITVDEVIVGLKEQRKNRAGGPGTVGRGLRGRPQPKIEKSKN